MYERESHHPNCVQGFDLLLFRVTLLNEAATGKPGATKCNLVKQWVAPGPVGNLNLICSAQT